MKFPCVLFDPECPMCVRFKQAIERVSLDIELHFYPIDDPQISEHLPHLTYEQYSSEVHLVISDHPNDYLVGQQVIEYLAKHNPSVKKLSWLLDTQVGTKASELFYQSVNKLRKSLHNHCPKCKKSSTSL